MTRVSADAQRDRERHETVRSVRVLGRRKSDPGPARSGAEPRTTVRLDVGLQIIGMHDTPDGHGPAASRPRTRPWRSTQGSCGRSGSPGLERHPDARVVERSPKAFFAVTQAPTTGPDAPRTCDGSVVIILNSASCRDETLCQRAS